jgi:hypothetical protein
VKRPRQALARVAAALAIGAVTLAPEGSGAWPGQEGDPHDGGAVREGALVDVDIDVQRANEVDLGQAFGDIRENVEAHRAVLAQAEQAVTAAEFELAIAEAKVQETQNEIDMLTVQADAVAVQAFVSPAAESALEALTADSPADAAAKQALLDIQATADADALESLQEAEDRLAERRALQEEAAAAAEDRRVAAEQALADLRAAADQQVAFTVALEDRLERNLSEAAGLAEIDPEMAQQLQSQQQALAMQINASRTALEQEEALAEAGVDPAGGSSDGPSTIEPVGGGVVSVSCPSGGAIEVAGDIARDVQGLLNRASAQGVGLCGTGWRDPSEQIALRRRHCGSSDWAIYEAPASACSPPTAPPGSSMHERGLAIDFTYAGGGAIGCGSEAYAFLDDNAADFGLYNLPGECWHWSTNGQ